MHYTYDEQKRRLLAIDDELQGDYKQSLFVEAQKLKIKDMKNMNLENFQLGEDGIIFYVYADDSSNFYYSYETHSQYFKSDLVNI